jgi:hypothetical protein
VKETEVGPAPDALLTPWSVFVVFVAFGGLGIGATSRVVAFGVTGFTFSGFLIRATRKMVALGVVVGAGVPWLVGHRALPRWSVMDH